MRIVSTPASRSASSVRGPFGWVVASAAASSVTKASAAPSGATWLRPPGAVASDRRAAPPRDLCETTIVGAHHSEYDARQVLGKRWRFQTLDSHLERLRYDPQIIQTEIQQEGQSHEVELTHVFVLVLINGLKPAVIAHGEISVVTLNQGAK